MTTVQEDTWFKYDQFYFSDCSIRRQFVKKVFILVTVMLSIVTIFAAFPFIIPALGTWLSGGPDGIDTGFLYFNISACVIFTILWIVLICSPKLTRMVPHNLILLGLFAMSAGLMIMCVTAWLSALSVLLCFAMTAGICGSVILFSIFVDKDLTSWMGFLFLFGFWVFFFGFTASIAIWACGVYWSSTLFAAIATIFFMLWLAIDVQLVMGGKKYELSPEEYVFGALLVFLDILNILLIVLMIFGKAN